MYTLESLTTSWIFAKTSPTLSNVFSNVFSTRMFFERKHCFFAHCTIAVLALRSSQLSKKIQNIEQYFFFFCWFFLLIFFFFFWIEVEIKSKRVGPLREGGWVALKNCCSGRMSQKIFLKICKLFREHE